MTHNTTLATTSRNDKKNTVINQLKLDVTRPYPFVTGTQINKLTTEEPRLGKNGYFW